jgi:hypothetical protein
LRGSISLFVYLFLSFFLSFFTIKIKMEEQFPVNSGKVPPPSQSTTLLSHQLAAATNVATFQHNNGLRRKVKEAPRSAPKVIFYA